MDRASWIRKWQDGTATPSLPFLVSGALILVLSVVVLQRAADQGGPKRLRHPIPGFNTLQFISNNFKFMLRVQRAMQGETLIRLNLGPKAVYLVTGSEGIRTIFGRELVHSVTNQEQMTGFALPTLYKMNAAEVQRWKQDKSGVTKVPIPGTDILPHERLWYNYEHIYSEYLSKPQHTKPLISMFRQRFEDVLKKYPTDWKSVSIRDFCRHEVAGTAVSVLFGPDLINLTPDFIDRFWNFDQHLFTLVLGFPRWINSKPYQAHDHYTAAVEKWLEHASIDYDWQGNSETEWEPRFGARAVRELYKWMKETHWRHEIIAATLGALAFALTTNSIPTTTWMLMEIISDPSLLKAVRAEIEAAKMTNTVTGNAILDSQKLGSLPLLQSIWTETLRLRVNFNVTRDVKEAIVIDGHTIPAGSMIQAPMMVSHYNETWGTTEHPASEFWAERHIKYDSAGNRTYAMAGRNTSFFPFGGGANICPGRQFAKLEVLTTVALVVSRLEIEIQGWTTTDGKSSDRPAQSDLKYCGSGAMPPDRDLRVRWRCIS
ncbi:putative cytochrome P450 [Nemania sp. FL0916]|nr:putative cytochrome P450 [Nemania sp. FL0916]